MVAETKIRTPITSIQARVVRMASITMAFTELEMLADMVANIHGSDLGAIQDAVRIEFLDAVRSLR